MTKNSSLIFIFTLFLTFSFGQKKSALKSEKVYLNKNDSSKNCYTIFYPNQSLWKGYLFLIPGFGETAENVLTQTDLPIKLAKNGILTIIPTFQDGVLSFGVDSLSQNSFKEILQDVSEKHKVQDLPFFVGGFSIGGSCAIKYAENPSIKPSAVFAIDPPLDFERFYNSATRDVRLSPNSEPNQENLYMIERIEKEAKGTPKTAIDYYYKLSPYSYSDTSQSAIKKLLNTPLRIYSEPDILWWLKERKMDYSGINITECSAMINELKRLGHKNSELIISTNKGFRNPDKRRHPHSWSIVDNDELILWLLK